MIVKKRDSDTHYVVVTEVGDDGKIHIMEKELYHTHRHLNAFLMDHTIAEFPTSLEQVDMPDSGCTTKEKMQKNLSVNKMLFRVGDIVEMEEPQDDEHETWLSKYRGEIYVVAFLDEEKEQYNLMSKAYYDKHKEIAKKYAVYNGVNAGFIDADLKPCLSNEKVIFNIEKIVMAVAGKKHEFSYSENVSKDTVLYIFGEHDVHVLVDGVGGFEAIVDPNGIAEVSRSGHLSEFEPHQQKLHIYHCEVCEDAWVATKDKVSYPHYACTTCRENDEKITFGNSIEFDNAEDYGN
jgi:predicted SprT family Zn-dependent metalloprotease